MDMQHVSVPVAIIHTNHLGPVWLYLYGSVGVFQSFVVFLLFHVRCTSVAIEDMVTRVFLNGLSVQLDCLLQLSPLHCIISLLLQLLSL